MADLLIQSCGCRIVDEVNANMLVSGWRLMSAIVSCGLMVACGTEERAIKDGQVEVGPESSVVSDSHTPPPSWRVDTSDVRAYLDEHGYGLDEIMSIQSDHVAAIASVGPDSMALVLLQVSDTTIRFVRRPPRYLRRNWWQMPTNVAWGSLSGTEVDALLVATNQPTERIIGATVEVKVYGHLRRTYDDPARACRSAEFVDIGGDGTHELVTYVDDLTEEESVLGYPNAFVWACFSPECCWQMVRLHGVAPAWTGVLEWNGSEWMNAEHQYPAFYEQLTEKYSAAAEWVRGLSEYTCAPGTDARLLEWAERARQRASGAAGTSN